MDVEHVDEYSEELCDVCHGFKHGLFVRCNLNLICEDCCKEMNRQLKIYGLTVNLKDSF